MCVSGQQRVELCVWFIGYPIVLLDERGVIDEVMPSDLSVLNTVMRADFLRTASVVPSERVDEVLKL